MKIKHYFRQNQYFYTLRWPVLNSNLKSKPFLFFANQHFRISVFQMMIFEAVSIDMATPLFRAGQGDDSHDINYSAQSKLYFLSKKISQCL